MDTRVLRDFMYLTLLIFCICRIATSQVCNNTWTTQPKTSVVGGTRVSGESTPSACQAICESQPKCTGIDINGAKECWLIYNGTLQRNDDDWVTHYQLVRNLNSCTAACTAPRSIGWVETRDAHVIGGTSKKTATAMKDCQQLCLDDDKCYGYDWDPQNPTEKCWLAFINNPIQEDAPNVLHYQKECPDRGLKIVTPGYKPPVKSVPTIMFSTITASTAAPVYGGSTYAGGIAAEMVQVEAHAIKPAYIVLAGLGGGCILMVIVGVSVICCYPLKGGSSGGGSHTKLFSKNKKTKVSKSNTGELHTRRPKGITDEDTDMGTVTARQKTYNDSYNSHKDKVRHSTEMNNQVDHVAYNIDHNTMANRSSHVPSDHGSTADRHSATHRNSQTLDHVNTGTYNGSTLGHNDHVNTYNGSTLDHKDRHSAADRDSNADRNSTLGRKDHTDYGHHSDEDHTAYNTIEENAQDNPYFSADNNRDDNYD